MRSHRSVAIDATIQKLIRKPSVAPSVMRPASQPVSSAATIATTAAQRKRFASSGTSACFQRASGPMPTRNTTGTISGRNTVSK